jgi:cysteinyl-tRNA synthetase
MATLWVHNGMLLVDGEKMSKSLGNFLTVRDILARGPWAGEAFRLLLLRTHYRAALDFSFAALEEAKAELDAHYRMLKDAPPSPVQKSLAASELADWAMAPLTDDLNTPLAVARLRDLRTLENALSHGGSAAVVLERIGRASPLLRGEAAAAALAVGEALGLLQCEPASWLRRETGAFTLKAEPGAVSIAGQDAGLSIGTGTDRADNPAVEAAIAARLAARKARNWAEADRIRDELKAQGIILEDRPDGSTDWRRA